MSLVALLAVGGCVGAAIVSGGSDEPTTSDDGGLDEWTESIFELTWNDMSAREQDELC